MAGSSRYAAVHAAVHDVSRAGAGNNQLSLLPTLRGEQVALRALRVSDAPSLLALLATPEVSRFIAPPPSTVEAFGQFIERVNHSLPHGRHMCFAITLRDHNTAIGLFQIREIEPDLKTIEWGFALGLPFWGTGVFPEAAGLVLEFIFENLGAHRVEARATLRNGRGRRALQKLGAAQEGVLRRALLRDGQYMDQVLYSIVEDDWRANRAAQALVPPVH